MSTAQDSGHVREHISFLFKTKELGFLMFAAESFLTDGTHHWL